MNVYDEYKKAYTVAMGNSVAASILVLSEVIQRCYLDNSDTQKENPEELPTEEKNNLKKYPFGLFFG